MTELRHLSKPGEKRICELDGCDDWVLSKGKCSRHYAQARRGAPFTFKPPRGAWAADGPCRVVRCERERYNIGLCKRHYGQAWSFGLSADEFVERINAVEACEICGRDEDLVVDHDHSCCPGRAAKKCGKCIRGFVCHGCNSVMGLARDDAETLRRAAEYLEARKLAA